MELNVCVESLGISRGSPDRDAIIGRIIENRLDEAHVLSWPGMLETFIPVQDTAGIDRVRSPFGFFDHRFDQVKGTAGYFASTPARIEVNFDLFEEGPRPGVDFLFLQYDLRTRQVLDPVWKLASKFINDFCTPRDCTIHQRQHWRFTANRTLDDPAAKFQVPLDKLGQSRGWLNEAETPSKPEQRSGQVDTVQPLEVGEVFQRRFDADFMAAMSGDELLLEAQPNIFGRHRIAITRKHHHWASIAIHGAFAHENNLIQVNIHAASFRPHPRHFILVQHFDRQQQQVYPFSWLINSVEFEKLARGKGDLIFTTTLNPEHVNRWTPYRMPSNEAPARFIKLLHAG